MESPKNHEIKRIRDSMIKPLRSPKESKELAVKAQKLLFRDLVSDGTLG